MIDSHCHLDLLASKVDLRTSLERATAAGLTRIMAPSINLQSWEALQALSEQYSSLLPIDTAIGLHPYFLTDSNQDNTASTTDIHEQAIYDNLEQLKAAAATLHPSVKAVGETGIDGHINVPLTLQKEVLHAHLKLADTVSLPVILHHRKSHHLLLEAFKQAKYQGVGVVHAFSGSVEAAKAYIERGFYLGIGGTITYERAHKTRDTLKYLLEHHFDKILLETDAPDMPMYGRQGAPNESQYLSDVVNVMHELFAISPKQTTSVTTENYFRLFKIAKY
ncbi:TatD family deoxyribonuclease [Alteromonas sp. BL110]|uniref:TatD family hydrolase n=1 Tax=Alteromonas sp. BL110 TaxID=1714845 RepID=UPI000E4BF92A|nr:TatD family hydrolase [Alteromonas sp. BL110]AXT39768.1 TatD family deoxyribonuclease [Alteromonas sp. BL110]RKM81745.1 TatD family deoxyribonuclease [Alteromonas sp. BL110]